ncbi:MAG: hypothetical protein M3Y18_03430 [Candidatus Eremiobacteraeota bacterium]|nr:hypothetical protein [Candidatus Eremiobacteraeota bacterium]
MTTGFNWAIVLDIGVGAGVFFIGIGVLIGMLGLARTFDRLNRTLDGVDEQISALGKPVSEALAHVGGIADTADRTVAQLAGVVGSLEGVARSVAGTAQLAQTAVSPALVNVGATLGGITAGIRRLVRGSEEA